MTAGVLDADWLSLNKKKKHLAGDDKTLPEIATWIAEEFSRFGIQKYPPTSTVLYWFVEGISRTQTTLETKLWDILCRQSNAELYLQESLVHAVHDARMDPVRMAMAACLCSRLQKIAKKAELGTTTEHLMCCPVRWSCTTRLTSFLQNRAVPAFGRNISRCFIILMQDQISVSLLKCWKRSWLSSEKARIHC